MSRRWRSALVRTVAAVAWLACLAGLSACDRKQAGGGNGPTTAATTTPTTTLDVFAAASLNEPFKEIGAQFEKRHPGVRVAYNFAGSQQLRSQLEEGSPADVFASANRKELDAVAAAGLVDAKAARTFARNRLVVIVPRDNPARLASLADLARPGVKLDLAAPAVPAGGYALVMLERMSKDPTYGADFKDRVLANVVSREENVKSVLNKVLLGEADAGVVYASDATGPAAGRVRVLQVPEPFNPSAEYPIAPLARSGHADLAARFVEFVLSDPGQEALRHHGFLAAGPQR